jgi:hypothetical protein
MTTFTVYRFDKDRDRKVRGQRIRIEFGSILVEL